MLHSRCRRITLIGGRKMKHAFLVQHVRPMRRSGSEDVKIIGIYRSRSSARLAIRRAKKRVGFRDWPEGFSIDRYEVGKDEWQDGFVTIVDRKKKADPFGTDNGGAARRRV
jgi:hypothetical protein